MTLKDFVIEAVSSGRNTKRYVELSPDMDIWEWIDNLRNTGLEEEHTEDLFVEPVPGKIYVSRFSNTGEWSLKFIAGSMRLKVLFYPDGKFDCIYSKKSKSTIWNFRKDVGPCIAEINYWLPEMVKEAVSRGRSGYKEMELNLSPEVTLDKFIEILEMNGYHVIEKLSDYMSVPDKTKEAWLQRRVTGVSTVKLVAGGKPFKLHFNNHDRFMAVMDIAKKSGGYDWRIIRYDEGTEQLSKLLTEAVSSGRSGYKSIELSPDITLDQLIVQLEKLGYKIVKRDSEWLEIPEKKTVWLFHEQNTGLSTLKLIAGGEPFKLSFDRKDNFICMFGIVEKPAGYDWNVIGFKSGMVKLSELLTEAVSSGRKGTVTIEYSVEDFLDWLETKGVTRYANAKPPIVLDTMKRSISFNRTVYCTDKNLESVYVCIPKESVAYSFQFNGKNQIESIAKYTYDPAAERFNNVEEAGIWERDYKTKSENIIKYLTDNIERNR